MSLVLSINSIDQTENVVAETIRKEDNINDERDILRFRVLQYSDRGFVPKINEDVELHFNGVKEFAGIIIEVEESIKHGGIVEYNVVCGNYTPTRRLVLERYDNWRVCDIIEDIVDKYEPDFTCDNIHCDQRIKAVAFNRINVSDCIEKLADLTGYYWRVDYNKDIHFFPKNENPAPFHITDTNKGYQSNSLYLLNDISQMRNVVVIRGGEERGEERTEEYISDGEQLNFPTANKFAEMPEVKINDNVLQVGADYLADEDKVDCLWSFQEKYVRFKRDTKPAKDDVVSFTGKPLFPIIVKISDPDAVEKYGEWEYFKEDNSIKSRDEAMQYARTQIEAYQDGVIEGRFTTARSGLRSGQIINIKSDLLGVDEDFLIQRASFRLVAKNRGEWAVDLATMRTVGITQFLQEIIGRRETREYDPGMLLSLLQASDEISVDDSLGDISATDTKDYYYDPVEVGQQKGKWNFATWAE